MKQLTYLFIFLNTIFALHSQNRISLDCQTPGWLSSMLTYTQQQEIEDLEVTGYINETDIKFISNIITNHKLNRIDLSKAVCVDGKMYLTHSGRQPRYISYPISPTFDAPVNMGVSDTLVVNSKKVVNITPHATAASNPIVKANHLILNDGVEEIGSYAIRIPNNYKRDYYMINKLPNSLKMIDGQAFCHEHKYPDSPELPNYIINPEINLPDSLEAVYSCWYYGQLTLKQPTIKFPRKLKTFGSKTESGNRTYYCTTFECDTLIVNSLAESIKANINTPVAVFYSEIPPSMEGKFNISRIYVPKKSLTTYKNKYSRITNDILPIEEVTTIEIDIKSNTLYVGESTLLKARILPEEAFDKNLKWTSTDQSVAIIDNEGVLTALKTGKTIIQATANNGVSKSIEITVKQHVSSFELLTEAILLNPGENFKLQYIILPEDASNKTIIWESADSNICAVSRDGMITAINPGSTLVTGTTEDGNLRNECIVKVIQPVESIQLTKNEISLKVGENTQISANILPYNAYNKSIIWKSSDETIAIVDESGMITALKAGAVDITALSIENPDIQDKCAVTVIQPVAAISIDKIILELKRNDSEQLTATVYPADASDKTINWISSDNSIAFVNSNGTVYALKEGEAHIIATSNDGNFSALCKVIVSAEDTSSISEVLYNTSADIKIFNLQGLIVYQGKISDLNLNAGTYIISLNGVSYKIFSPIKLNPQNLAELIKNQV